MSIGVAGILSAGIFSAVAWMSKVHSFEKRLTFYSSEVREVIHQIARDLRAAGSNPLSRPFLFDGDPPSDIDLVLDPLRDSDITNDIEVHFDRYGGQEWTDPDGDADDAREAVRYWYGADAHRLYREVRMDDGWAQEVILVNVCSFGFSFLDAYQQPTTDPALVNWVQVSALTTTAPATCYDRDEITREWSFLIRLRNR